MIYIIPIYSILFDMKQAITDNQKFKHNGQAIKRNIKLFLNPKYSIKFKYLFPIILSPMDTVSSVKSCTKINQIGGAGVLHRFMSIEDQTLKSKKIKENRDNYAGNLATNHA